MRIDEQGRWVSDDGFYVWDESVQTWVLRDQSQDAATGGRPLPDGTGDPFDQRGAAATTLDASAGNADDAAPAVTAPYTGPATAATAVGGQPVVDDTRTPDGTLDSTSSWDRTVDGPGGIETVAHGGAPERRPRPPWLWPSVVGVLAVVAAVVLFLFLRDNGDSTAVASPTATGQTPTEGTTGAPSTTPGTPVPSSLMPGSPSSGASGSATAPASPGGATPAPGPAGTWTAPVGQMWLSSCAGAGGDQGYCRCTLKQLQQRFTQAQFLAFNADPQSARTKAALQPVYAACMPSS